MDKDYSNGDFDGMEDEMSDEEFASLIDNSMNQDGNKTVTTGVLISINDEFALVDVGQKVEGRLYCTELQDESGVICFKEGDSIPVLIMGYRNERPMVSYQKAIKQEKTENFIKSLGDDFENIIIEGKVTKKNKGGFIVTSNNVDFFMPKYMSGFKDDAKVMGKSVKAMIINVKPEDGSIIISRKKFFENEFKKKKEVIDTLLEKKVPAEGVVNKITSFGMFVDVDGVEGLVHYTEISYKGPVNPAKHYQEGDKVVVIPIGYDEEKRRLSLSIKQTHDDPWNEIKDELVVGDAIKVTVSNIEPYGVFVDLGNDIEGFLHISKISWNKNIKHPSEYLEQNQEIDVEVIEIDSQNRRLRVSLKKLTAKPFEKFLSSHKEGEKITGEVATLTDFGAFIRIGGIDGLLHNEDAFWNKNEKCKDVFKVGDKVEAVIVKIDKDKERVSLSRKELIESPAQGFMKKHNIDDIVKGKVRDIKDFGVFISLEDGVDALIRKEDLHPMNPETIKVGDDIEGVVSMVDPKTNKIRVSIRRLEKIKEKESLKQFNDDDKMTLGDILKDQMQ